MNTYDNPTPVGVHLQRAWTRRHEAGLVIVQRSDNGQWALPGGYVENGKDASLESGAAREFFEETGWAAQAGTLRYSVITPNGKLLAFCTSVFDLYGCSEEGWTPTEECTAIRIATEAEELCFPAHTEAMRLWFENPHW